MRSPLLPLAPLADELQPLLERERLVPPLSPAMRALVLARARAVLVARMAPTPLVSARVPRGRWAIAAALLCLVSTAATAAVIEFRARLTHAPARVTAPAAAMVAPAPVPRRTARGAQAPIVPVDEPQMRRLPPGGAVREELRLLKQARAAVAHEEYGAALRFIAEHGRRFKDGRLVEEREALRVWSLAGLGRSDEAQRAAAAFSRRFPRSVLIEAVSGIPAAKP